jgi:hypothetical protein
MAEEKQEKKKPGIIRRIFRRIWLWLLVVLILGALIYDAPWKVLALLLIILAAHTILPKGAVKWFWLSVAAVVIVLIIWVFLLDETEVWRPYTFDEELAALEAKYAVPDSENAAVLYSKLFETLDTDSNAPEFFSGACSPSTSEPWLSKDHPETAEWLKGQQDTIESLLQISKMDKCQFPLQVTPWDFPSDRYYSKMRHCAFLLVSSANNDMAEGQTDAALEKWLCLIQMGKHLCQQPAILDTMTGFAFEGLATKQLKRFIITGEPAESHLSVLEQALQNVKLDWRSDLPKFLEYEKLFEKNTICCLAYQRNPQGKARLSRDPIMSILRIQFPEEKVPSLSYWQRKLTGASAVILDWFFMPSTPQKASKIIDASFEKYYAMTDPNFTWQKEPPPLFSKPTSFYQLRFDFCYFAKVIADMQEHILYDNHKFYLRQTAENRGSRIVIALRRYKNKTSHWPENLEEVKPLALAEIFVDPLNNDSFIYKLTDEGFTLYSKGKNNIDEGGKRDKWDEEKTGADDWLIWPPKSHKTKKENTDD